MMSKERVKRIKRVPIRGGIPLKRIHTLTCLCEHEFTVDLDARNMGDEIHCPKCGVLLGKIEDVIFKKWRVEW